MIRSPLPTPQDNARKIQAVSDSWHRWSGALNANELKNTGVSAKQTDARLQTRRKEENKSLLYTHLVYSDCGGNLKGQVRADCYPTYQTNTTPSVHQCPPSQSPTTGDSVLAHKLAFLSWEKADSVLSEIRRLFVKIENQSVSPALPSPPSSGANGFGCVCRWTVSLLYGVSLALSCRALREAHFKQRFIDPVFISQHIWAHRTRARLAPQCAVTPADPRGHWCTMSVNTVHTSANQC